jgi:hypothetical protein
MTLKSPESSYTNLAFYNTPGFDTISIPESEALALYWNFDLIEKTDNGDGGPFTTLNDAGFDLLDNSSGSVEQLTRYPVVSAISRKLHPGRANFFLRNNLDVISYEYIPNAKLRLPEILNNDDLVKIIERDDEVYTRDTKPVNHYLMIEKSMYQNISEEMLRWIGTITQFNNLIGKPKDRYELEYKDLTYLRRLFFQNIDNEPDFEKFVDFYKWIDESVIKILMELIPASMNTTTVASNMIESHILERNKYRHKLPILEFKDRDPIVAVRTINELKYNWRFGHAPIPLSENENCVWWKLRQEKEGDREKIFDAVNSSYDRKLTTVYDLNVDPIVIIDKNPKNYDIAKTTTKFGSGEYLEIDVALLIREIDCKDGDDK